MVFVAALFVGTALAPITSALGSPPAITTDSLPAGQVGQSYGVALEAAGGMAPYLWTGVTLPAPGLTFDSRGILAGTPTEPGSYEIQVRVVDAALRSATKTFTLAITGSALHITTTVLPAGLQQSTYQASLSADGGAPPYLWTVTGLPTGLALDAASGTILGLAPEAGEWILDATVTDATATTVSQSFPLTIAASSSGPQAAPPPIAGPPLPPYLPPQVCTQPVGGGGPPDGVPALCVPPEVCDPGQSGAYQPFCFDPCPPPSTGFVPACVPTCPDGEVGLLTVCVPVPPINPVPCEPGEIGLYKPACLIPCPAPQFGFNGDCSTPCDEGDLGVFQPQCFTPCQAPEVGFEPDCYDACEDGQPTEDACLIPCPEGSVGYQPLCFVPCEDSPGFMPACLPVCPPPSVGYGEVCYTPCSDAVNELNCTHHCPASQYDAPAQASTVIVEGCVYLDINLNGQLEALLPGSLLMVEPGLENVKVYLDLNNNTGHDEGEPFGLSDSNGYYWFLVSQFITDSVVREVPPSPLQQTGPRPADGDDYSQWFYYSTETTASGYKAFNFGNNVVCVHTQPDLVQSPPELCSDLPGACALYGPYLHTCDPSSLPPPCSPAIPGMPRECLPVPHPLPPPNEDGSSPGDECRTAASYADPDEAEDDPNGLGAATDAVTFEQGCPAETVWPYDWPNSPFEGVAGRPLCGCGVAGGGDQGNAGTVNVYTGEFKYNVMPVNVPAHLGSNFQFNMTYRSLNPAATSRDGMFGHNWDYGLGAYIKDTGNGALSVHRGDGQALTYAWNAAGTMAVAPRGIYNYVEPDGADSYKLTERHGDVYTFKKATLVYPYTGLASEYLLVSIVDRNGNELKIWPGHAALDAQNRLYYFGNVTNHVLGFHNGDFPPAAVPGFGVVQILNITAIDRNAAQAAAYDITFDWESGYYVVKDHDGHLINTPDCTDWCVKYENYYKEVCDGATCTTEYVDCTPLCGRDNFTVDFRVLATFSGKIPPSDGDFCLGGITVPGVGNAGFSYDASAPACRVKEVADPYATGSISNAFDIYGRVSSQEGKRQYGFIYDRRECHTTVIDGNLNVRDYYCESWARLLTLRLVEKTKTGDEPHVTHYSYNENGEIVTIHFPRGNLEHFIYDEANEELRSQGNMLCHIRDPGPFLIGLDAEVQLPIITKYEYETDFNQVTKVIDPRGSYPGYLPPNGGLADEERYTTTYGYDANGNMATAAYPAGGAESWSYNGAGQVTQHTTVLGATETYEYAPHVGWQFDPADGEGYLIKHVQDPGGFDITTTYERDLDGNPTGVVDPRGHETKLTWTPGCRLVGVKAPAPLNYTAAMTYNDAGDVESSSRTDAPSYSRVYGIFGDVDHAFTGLGHVAYCYDYNGNVILERRPESVNGNQYWDLTSTIYDERDQPIQVTRGDIPPEWWGQRIRGGPACHAPFVAAPGTVGTGGISCNDPTGSYYIGKLLNRHGDYETYGAYPSVWSDYVGEPDGCPALDSTNVTAGLYILARGDVTSTTKTKYDGNANLIARRDGMGAWSFSVYDGYDRKIDDIDALGGHSESRYDPASNVVEQRFCGAFPRDPALEHFRIFTFWDPVMATLACQRTVTSHLYTQTLSKHDEANRVYETNRLFQNLETGLKLQDGPLTPLDGYVTTRTEFNAAGQVTKTTNDNEHSSQTWYDILGRINSTRDAAGNWQNTTYDEASNPVESQRDEYIQHGPFTFKRPMEETQREYDEVNQVSAVTDPEGETTEQRIDAAGKLAERTSPAGHKTLQLNNYTEGSKEDVYDAGWDSLSEAWTQKTYVTDDPYGTVVAGDVTRITFQNGTLVRFHGAPTVTTVDGVTTIVGNEIYTVNTHHPVRVEVRTFTDKDGRVIAQDGATTTNYTYDALGRKIKELNADGTHTDYAFDANDRMTSYDDPNGNVVTFTLDLLGRITHVEAALGTGVIGTTDQEFTYDAMGHVLTQWDREAGAPLNDHVITKTYDSLGNVLSESQDGFTMVSTHDGLGHRTLLTYPSGITVATTYDELERPDTITGAGVTVTYGYNGPGLQVSSREFGNGESETRGFDLNDRIIALSNSGIGFEYDYDAAGRLVGKNKTHQPTDSESFNLDGIGRLRGFSRGDIPVADVKGQTWNFDDHDETTGNNWESYEVETQSGTVSAERDHNGVNKLLQEELDGALQNFTYDANGNLLSDEHREFKWDFKNRLRQVTNLDESPPVVFAVYEYDSENRRVKATNPVNGEIRTYVSSGMNEIEQHSTLIGATPVVFVHGVVIDELIGRTELDATGAVASVLYYVQDEQQNVYALVDTTGAVVEGYEYDPYGRVTVYKPGTSGLVEFTADDDIVLGAYSQSEYMFTGRRYDADAELYYFRSRYMDVELGRFISSDSVGAWGDLAALGNAFAYAANHPSSASDPMGTDCWGWTDYLCDAGAELKDQVVGGIDKTASFLFGGDCAHGRGTNAGCIFDGTVQGFDSLIGNVKGAWESARGYLGCVGKQVWGSRHEIIAAGVVGGVVATAVPVPGVTTAAGAATAAGLAAGAAAVTGLIGCWGDHSVSPGECLTVTLVLLVVELHVIAARAVNAAGNAVIQDVAGYQTAKTDLLGCALNG